MTRSKYPFAVRQTKSGYNGVVKYLVIKNPGGPPARLHHHPEQRGELRAMANGKEVVMKFQRSPKAHGWYYAESASGTGYSIAKGEFMWHVSVGGKRVASCRTLKEAKAAAKAHAEAGR